MPKTLKERLTEYLIKNVVTKEQLAEAVKFQQEKGGNMTDILMELGFITEKQIVAGMSEYMGLPPVSLEKLTVSPDVVKLIPRSTAVFYQAVPISRAGNILTAAMADPLNILAIDDLRLITGMEIQPVITTTAEIKKAIKNYYEPSSEEIQDIIKEVEIFGVEDKKEENIDISEVMEQTDKIPVIRLVNLVIYRGIKDRASDIHIEPFEDSIRLRYRIDGILYESPPPPRHLHPAICSRIKILSRLDIAERRIPQDGRFRVRMEGKDIDFRVSVLPTAYGEKVVLRILDKSSLAMDLEKLGLSGRSLDIFNKCIKAPNGMILLTGPTGSGKTTTLYSALKAINKPEVNIITIEDPIEYQFAGMNQTAVRPEVGLTFASGLRSILRQDPDIIMVGEIRDLETAEIAVQAALTGHLVFSTLHTNDAAGAVTRLEDMGIEPFLLSSSVLICVAQRLVRKICPECREPAKIDLSVLEHITGCVPQKGSKNVFYKGAGCKQCKGIGYKGRIALYEILKVDKDIQELILKRNTSEEIKRYAVEKGMQTLRDAGIEKAREGLTTIEEVIRVTAGD